MLPEHHVQSCRCVEYKGHTNTLFEKERLNVVVRILASPGHEFAQNLQANAKILVF